MATVKVTLKQLRDNSYTIRVSSGIFSKIPVFLKKYKRIAAWVIVSDATVAKLYGGKLLKAMRQAGLKTRLVTFPAGERSKSRKLKARLDDAIFDTGLGRDGGIVALGGGVTGDMAGFIASTYMRGIPFVQVPTTLLAMVDSSVGGKTGIDVPAGKNLVGAFHQPLAVFIDPELLKTLPRSELLSGMAEVVKHAVIADASLFDLLEKRADALLELDKNLIERVIARNCAIKARVVEKDEREAGLRQILNYGHTIGHAVEKLSRYRISHGRAVAIGMAAEGNIARRMNLMPGKDLERQNALLKRLGFNLDMPKRISRNDVIRAMEADKKVRRGRIRMALPAGLGKMVIRVIKNCP